jgi:hypothetical protein
MKYIIAGFGRFGGLALTRLAAAFPNADIVVVEKTVDPTALESSGRAEAMEGDAVEFLIKSPSLGAEDIVIPMVPFHLAAEYLLARHPDLRRVPLPHRIEALVPNPYRVDDFNLCCSLADSLCPDDCPEAEICAVTGEYREKTLFRLFAETEAPGFTTVVLRSLQILPGIGGYAMADLRGLAERIERGKYIVATSCRCHGVMTAIERFSS